VPAARENIAYGAKSTEFMAPPNFAFDLMRQATLRLALEDPRVRSLVNPRQSAPVAYDGSPLNGETQGGWRPDGAPGSPAPEALLEGAAGQFHLSQGFGKDFVALVFADGALPAAVARLAEHGVAVLEIAPEADALGQARDRYGVPASGQGLVLVRPDGYVAGRWEGLDAAPLLAWLRHQGLAE
jgi:3-(3-hydroxy-phenyl)propionate hydroxylase